MKLAIVIAIVIATASIAASTATCWKDAESLGVDGVKACYYHCPEGSEVRLIHSSDRCALSIQKY